jgi:hypothetical protein
MALEQAFRHLSGLFAWLRTSDFHHFALIFQEVLRYIRCASLAVTPVIAAQKAIGEEFGSPAALPPDLRLKSVTALCARTSEAGMAML